MGLGRLYGNKRVSQRNQAFKKLFSANESTRKVAQREIVSGLGNEPGFVKEMLQYAMNDKRFVKENINSMYQIVYILTQVNAKTLSNEKVLIQKFFKKLPGCLSLPCRRCFNRRYQSIV